jgi:enoyl-CoA hydratase
MDLNQPPPQDIAYETEEPVLYEAKDGVAWVTMSRPAYNNVQNKTAR